MISDTVPQTVYGNYWSRTLNPSVATLSVAEIFFANREFEIYYSQPDVCEPVPCEEEPCNPEPCDPDPDQIQHLEGYTTDYTNPRAGCMKLQDGSWDCGFNSIATKISWPFQQQEIPLNGGEIADSLYYFAWQSGIYEPSDATDYRMRITIRTPDPDRPGEFLEGVFEYTPNVMKKAPVVFTVTDEAGDTIADDFLINLLYMMGDRKAYMAFIDPERLTTENVPVGDYALFGQRGDGGILLPGLHEVEYFNRDQITVPEQGLTTSVQLDFRYQEQDLAIARGLLRDLDDWRVAGDPFGDFVQQAEAWLDEIEKDGLTFEEAVALKRFYMTLSGYANMTEYAQLQSEGAIEDVQWMVQDFRDIVEQVDALRGNTLDSWEEELAGALLTIIYNFFTYGEFSVMIETIETALEELETYIATEIADEIRQLIMEQIPDGPYKAFIQILINVCIDADFEDWDAAVVAIQDLLFDEAIDELLASLAEDFVATLFSDIDLDGPLEEAIADLIESVLAALVGNGFTDFGQVLDKFSQDVGVYVQQNGHTKVKQAVNEVFDQLEAQLPAGEVRDFLVGITRDLVLQAIPTVKGGQLNYDIDNDVLANVLVKHALYNVVLKEYYVQEARTGMFAALDRARHYVLEDETSYDQESSIRSDYMDYTTVIKGLQDPAWNALTVQDDIESWANLLDGLTTILDILSAPLDVIAAVYPPLKDTADAVHGLIAALDSAQILTRAIEFGLKLECLDNFADQVEPLYLIMFPDPG